MFSCFLLVKDKRLSVYVPCISHYSLLKGTAIFFNLDIFFPDLCESQETPLLLESEIEQLRKIVEPENSNMTAIFKGVLQTHSWVSNENVCQVLQQPLIRLCCRYLYREKRRGYALNPVGEFCYK